MILFEEINRYKVAGIASAASALGYGAHKFYNWARNRGIEQHKNYIQAKENYDTALRNFTRSNELDPKRDELLDQVRTSQKDLETAESKLK